MNWIRTPHPPADAGPGRVRPRHAAAKRDRGATAVLAVFLMILVLVAPVGALVWYTSMHTRVQSAPAVTGVAVDRGDDTLRLTPSFGDAVPVHDGHIFAIAGSHEVDLPLTLFEDRLGDHWDPGESICLAGTAPDCPEALDGKRITELRLVGFDQLLWQWEGNFTPWGKAGAPAAAPSKVDLLVDLISFTPASPAAGDAVVFTVRARNVGTDALAAGADLTLRFFVDSALVSSESIGTGLAPNETAIVDSDAWNATPGVHDVIVLIDVFDEVVEITETNNQVSADFSVSEPAPPSDDPGPGDAGGDPEPGPPDLVVRFLSTSPASPSSGDAVTFTGRVTNGGGTDVPVGTDIAVQFLVDGVVLSVAHVTSGLAPGASADVTSDAWAAEPGSHDILLHVDADDVVDETDENNNDAPTAIEVGSKATLCHYPPGNAENAHTLSVGAPAVNAHLAHGDTLGACDDDDADPVKAILCHIPPGNPENEQTIRVGQSAVDAHLAHGDHEGVCVSDAPPSAPAAASFSIEPDGGVRTSCALRAHVIVLGTAITYGAGGPVVPVRASATTNGAGPYGAIFGGAPVSQGQVEDLGELPADSVIGIQGTAKYKALNAAYSSLGTDPHVIVLQDGDPVPAYDVFDGQSGVESFLEPYLDVASGVMVLEPNEAILLFDFNKGISSRASDFQDLVVLIAFDRATC